MVSEPKNITTPATQRVADARPGNWVDNYAPLAIKPYLRLARLDRPIGIWLLLWPCWWSLALAAQQLATHPGNFAHVLMLMGLFAFGAIVMRGAGCTYNDIVDRHVDAAVARTRARPLPSGAISLKAAVVFFLAQLFLGACVLLSFNRFTILLGLSSLVLIAIYPFMKRVTYWPQLFLGLAFSFGALLGWSAIAGSLSLGTLLLYAGTIFWVMGYDTIYAHQDKEDDLLLGMKSTALKFGAATKSWLFFFYSAAIFFFSLCGWVEQTGFGFQLGLAIVSLHFAWQIGTLDIYDAQLCLRIFRSNREAGGLIFLACLMGTLGL